MEASQVGMEIGVGGLVGGVGITATNYGMQYLPADSSPWTIAAIKAAIGLAGGYGIAYAGSQTTGVSFGAVMLAAALNDAFEAAKTRIAPGGALMPGARPAGWLPYYVAPGGQMHYAPSGYGQRAPSGYGPQQGPNGYGQR